MRTRKTPGLPGRINGKHKMVRRYEKVSAVTHGYHNGYHNGYHKGK